MSESSRFITTLSLASRYQRIGGACCLHHQGKSYNCCLRPSNKFRQCLRRYLTSGLTNLSVWTETRGSRHACSTTLEADCPTYGTSEARTWVRRETVLARNGSSRYENSLRLNLSCVQRWISRRPRSRKDHESCITSCTRSRGRRVRYQPKLFSNLKIISSLF